jgi:predicted 2-oxoglutarate/Fe(II)-dependent dioxygenase YbiX
VATGAAWLEGRNSQGEKRRTKTSLQQSKKEKTDSTLTGLLMEGLETFLVHFSMVAVVPLTVLTNSLSCSRQDHQPKSRFFLRVRWGGFLVYSLSNIGAA